MIDFQNKKSLFKLVFLIFFGVFLSLIIGEIFVRIWKSDIAYQPDSDIIRSLRPNVVHKIYSFDTPAVLENLPAVFTDKDFSYIGMEYTNNVGFRMKEDVYNKEKDKKRILIFGDSFTEGQNVPDEQRFYYLVQDKIMQAGFKKWRVINAGIQNGSPSQYILMLRRYIKTIEPDIVLVFLNASDSTDDFHFEDRYGFEFNKDGIPERLKSFSRTKLWLFKKLWLFRYLEVFAQRKLDKLYEIIWWPHYLAGKEEPDMVKLLCTKDSYNRNVFLSKTGNYLKELKRMSENNNAQFGVVIVNFMNLFDNEPYYLDNVKNLTKIVNEACGQNHGGLFREFLNNFFSDNQINYLDPYVALMNKKTSGSKERMWGYYDYHFAPAGHKIMADEITRFLIDKFELNITNK